MAEKESKIGYILDQPGDLSCLTEKEVIEFGCQSLRMCSETLREMTENIDSAIARMDEMECAARLYDIP